MASTSILSIKPKRGGMVEVTTSHPNKTFVCNKNALDSPASFRNAFWTAVQGRAVGPCFGDGLYVPMTKGRLRQRWQEFLGKATNAR